MCQIHRPNLPGLDALADAIREAEALDDTQEIDCTPARTHCMLCNIPLGPGVADATGMMCRNCCSFELEEPKPEDWEEFGDWITKVNPWPPAEVVK